MNKNIRCLIVDDEPIGRAIIEEYVRETPFLELVASCKNSLQAIEKLQNMQVDLLLTDISMPGIDGFMLVRSLISPPVIIFITAHENYALESYDLDVADYLLKPVTRERFLKAVNKARKQLDLRNIQNISTPKQSEDDYIFVNSDKKLLRILIEDIVYIEALRDYVRIHTRDNKSLVIKSSMKAMVEKLPAKKFFRIHSSQLVNLNHMKAIFGNSMEMITGGTLPISRDRKVELLKFLHIHDQEKGS